MIYVGPDEAERLGVPPGEMEPWKYTLLRSMADPGSYDAMMQTMGDDVVLDGLVVWADILRHSQQLMPPDAIETFEAGVEHLRQVCVAEARKRGLPLLATVLSPGGTVH
jgi:hypothetical protein